MPGRSLFSACPSSPAYITQVQPLLWVFIPVLKAPVSHKTCIKYIMYFSANLSLFSDPPGDIMLHPCRHRRSVVPGRLPMLSREPGSGARALLWECESRAASVWQGRQRRTEPRDRARGRVRQHQPRSNRP